MTECSSTLSSNLQSLAYRRLLGFVLTIPPWKTKGWYHVHITPKIPGIHKKIQPARLVLQIATELLSRKCKNFNHSFWTDGSVNPSGYGTAACMAFPPTKANPTKRWQLNDGSSTTTIMVRPVGFVDASCLSEKTALELVPTIITHCSAQYSHSNVFVGSDSQSSLMALAAGSHRDYHHACTGYTWSHTYEEYLDVANEHTIHFHLQWIPSHVGVKPNEEIDNVIGNYSSAFACTTMQREQPTKLKAIKSSVKHRLRMKWITGNVSAAKKWQSI